MAPASPAPRLRLPVLFIVKPGSMSAKDMRRAEKQTGLCIVQCTDPDAVRMLEPPIDAEIPAQARAALSLFRYIKDTGTSNTSSTFYKGDLLRWFVDALCKEPTPPPVASVKVKQVK